MKRLFCILVSLVLLATFSATALASETVSSTNNSPEVVQSGNQATEIDLPDGAVQPNQPTQPTVPTTTTAESDNTARTVTDGLHLEVYYSADQDAYIPQFTLELWDIPTDTLISSTTGSSLNFANGKYSLIFAHPGFKLNDQLALILRKADGIIEHLDVNGLNLEVDKHVKFSIDPFVYYEGVNDEKVFHDLTATKLHPITATLKTNPSKVGLQLKTKSGTILKQTPVDIKLLQGKGYLQATSDDNGMVWLDSQSLTWKFLVSKEDHASDQVEVELPPTSITRTQKGIITLPIIFNDEAQIGSISVSLTTEANTDLSSKWSEADFVLTALDGVASTHHVNLDTTEIAGMRDGEYKLSVANAKYADITLESDSFAIAGGIGGIKGAISPKHVLEISKDGKPYNFSVININHIVEKQYTGTQPILFAATPGESYMIKDNDTGKIETVSIESDSPTTKVILGAGVVFGGSVSIPHTGDSLPYLIAGLILSILITAVSFTLYLKKRKISSPKNSAMSLLLAVALVAPLFAPTGVNAAQAEANVGGTQPATGNATSQTAAGTFQVSESIAVLQFGYIPNKVKPNGEVVLSASSGVSDLEDPFKFENEPLMFYMAPSQLSDSLWRKEGSGLITFERGSGVKTLYGNNPLYPDSPQGQSHDELMKRTLNYADNARNVDDNYFEKILGDVLYNIDSSNPNRSLSGEGNDKVIGDSLKTMIEDYISNRKDGSDLDARIIGSLMFGGYLDLIRSRGILTDEAYNQFEQMMWEEYRKGELIFFAQTVIGITVKDNRSAFDRDFAFISMHDATDWYLWTRQTARPTDTVVQGLTANREFEAVSKGGATTAEQGSLSPYKENGNLPNTFRTYARDYYARTLKPVTSAVPMSIDDSINPFGGWGFQPWGYGSRDVANTPAIDAQLNVTVVDNNGNPTNELFTVPVTGWSENDKQYLRDLTSSGDTLLQGGMEISHEGKTYELLPDNNAKFTLLDKMDNENINKLELTKEAVGEDLTIPVPSSKGSSTWEIRLGYDTPLPLDLNSYLGGEAASVSTIVENKYEGTKHFSNAQLTLFVKAREYAPSEPIATGLVVPQWRLSKYWDMISDSDSNQAKFSLSLPSETGEDAWLSPSGSTSFSLIDPDLTNVPWAISRTKLAEGESNAKMISASNNSARFSLTGDLLAIRDNASVSNIKLASWINAFNLFNSRITATSTGSSENKPTVTKSNVMQYGVRSPHSSYTYSETRYDWISPVYDAKGNLLAAGYDDPYTWSGTADPSYQTADYEANVTFNRYIPKDSRHPKLFEDVSESSNGTYWQTKQADETIYVNPEVLYAYDDQSGNTSVAFAAGDKLRPITPVSYNLAQFVNVNVKPTVTGTSAATDANAKALAKKLNANDKQVLYKGSAVTTNFEVQGDLELKSYVLDIGSSALKNAWNPTTTYSTDAINDKYLSEYATKDANTGKWQVKLDANGELVINGKDYSGKSAKLTAIEKDDNVTNYVLEVRGGKLVGVNGNRDLNSLPQELKDVLTRMHILGNDNNFSSFESGSGDNLTEQAVADLGNAVRGSNDLKVGSGWYGEDSTILIVREYTTTFQLPSHMYVDKVPMQILGLEVESDKSLFFSKGYTGHTKLSYKVGNVGMVFDSSKGDFGGDKSTDFVVGNVSVLDTFSSQ